MFSFLSRVASSKSLEDLAAHVYLKTRASVWCVYTGAVFRFALSNMAGM